MAHPELQDSQSVKDVIIKVGVVILCFICHKQMVDECNGAFLLADTCYLHQTLSLCARPLRIVIYLNDKGSSSVQFFSFKREKNLNVFFGGWSFL
jgi:hypothetical protein